MQDKIWVIMPKGQGNTLAWSANFWYSKEDAEIEMQTCYPDAWQDKWCAVPLRCNTVEPISESAPAKEPPLDNKLSKAAQGAGWINVKDKLPENDNLVMVWFCKANHLPDYSYGYEEFAYWDGKIWEQRDAKSGKDMESNQDMRIVTHWQLLPQQPKI